MRRFSFLPAILALILFVPAARCADGEENALAAAHSRRLWRDPQWLALGHYKKSFLGGTRSEVDDPRFFLSPRGKTDPQAEMEATIRTFSRVDPSTDADHQPACFYPARYQWLAQELDWIPAESASACVTLDRWLDTLNGHALALVFASAYLHSPATMYGHTFLRLDQDPAQSASLLSYSISFAANAPPDNGVLFAIKGLTGLYPGTFATVPYYVKIQRYGGMESRDLWEYPLNFSPAEIHLLLLHLWEIGRYPFAYYFLTKNCAYQLLPLLEVARPSLRLSARFRFKAIPMDTIRVVTDASGLTGGRLLRPSALRLMTESRDTLKPGEIQTAEVVAKDPGAALPGALDALPQLRRGTVLQAAYQLFRYHQGFRRFLTPGQDAQEFSLLRELNRLDVPVAEEVRQGPASEAPEEGHRTGRIGFLGGIREGKPVGEISLRPALHDLLDPAPGYIPFSRLEMFHLKLRYSAANEKATLSQLDLVDLLSLYPYDRWAPKPSWGMRIGVDQREDVANQSWDTLQLHVNGRSGMSFRLHDGSWKALVYGLGQVDCGAGPAFDRGFRTGGGAAGGMTLELPARMSAHAEESYDYYFWGDEGGKSGLAVGTSYTLSRNAQLRFTYEAVESVREYLFGLYLYL